MIPAVRACFYGIRSKPWCVNVAVVPAIFVRMDLPYVCMILHTGTGMYRYVCSSSSERSWKGGSLGFFRCFSCLAVRSIALLLLACFRSKCVRDDCEEDVRRRRVS